MAEKVKVYNRCKHNYGVTTAAGTSINIKPGSFAMLTEDDIAYIQSIVLTSKSPFASGKLVVGDEKGAKVMEDLGIDKNESNYLEDDAAIEKKLKGTNASVKKWLEGITDAAILSNIVEIAKGLDLPNSKLKMLEEKYPNAGLYE